MGGRGTFAAGKKVDYTYETFAKIDGVKVLRGLNGLHDLPMESHSSEMYIKVNPDNTFKELRVYGKDHRVELEIAYHVEPKLQKGGKKVLHYHVYDYGPQYKNGLHRTTALLTPELRAKYHRFFIGVKE